MEQILIHKISHSSLLKDSFGFFNVRILEKIFVYRPVLLDIDFIAIAVNAFSSKQFI